MATVNDCCSPCPTIPPVNVPGIEGPAGTNGTNGTNGGNAYTTTTASFVIPALTASVTVSVVTTAFMAIGQYLFVSDGTNEGIFQVASVLSGTSVSLTYINDPRNTQAGNTMASGAVVTPGGSNGTSGTSGNNGYTFTNSVANPTFVTPAIGGTALITVLDTSWMIAGQYVQIAGSGIYQVQAVNSSTSFTGLYPNFTVNTNATVGINSGTKVVLSIPGVIAPITFYASGAAYTVASTTVHPTANLAIGGTNTAVTLTTPGTWMIFSRARYDLSANATFAASNLTTTKLRRTNNTAADLAPTASFNSPTAWFASIATAAIQEVPPNIYTTANNSDVIELWGSSAAVTTAGTLTAVEAEIVAIFLHP